MVRQPIIHVPYKQKGSISLESIFSLSILFILFIISMLIFMQQFRFDEKYFSAFVLQNGQGETEADTGAKGEGSLDINLIAPEGFTPMSGQENFDTISLSDKINGKADGYLQAGFVELACRRFVNDSNQEQWFEFYLYDMGLPRNAFSVYSSQKREGVTPQDFTEFAYSTENALFFAFGRFYVEIISANKDEELIKVLIVTSKDFIENQPSDNVNLPELEFLPKENLDQGSISLLAKNGFGYEGFDNIITATYEFEDKKVLAFISIRETPEEAAALAKGYNTTLSEFVGEERHEPETSQVPGLIIADVFGEYEIFFAKENIIAGIHSAPDKKVGEETAINLYNKISESIK